MKWTKQLYNTMKPRKKDMRGYVRLLNHIN